MALWLMKKGNPEFNFHDDAALADKALRPTKPWSNLGEDAIAIIRFLWIALAKRKGFSVASKEVAASLDTNDPLSRLLTQNMVTTLWGSMLHPPMSYRGNKFQYRTADGSYNNILYPELGKSGLPYAKTVQGKYAAPGAKPDPGDLFDLLMARPDNDRESASGISMMLLFHATTIIHDIFRTDDEDANISATSSYLDLAPLYGSDVDAQRSVRAMRDGMLKPDTFAEPRLANQPPGVQIYLIMYNRFHNYVAEQLLQINENGRFSLPPGMDSSTPEAREKLLARDEGREALEKQDEDLFQTARLVTCGMYIQIAIHDYLKCLMLSHATDTPWSMDPRVAYPEKKNAKGLSRGEGNMVSVEFNLLYRFHSPISAREAQWSEDAFIGLAAAGGMLDEKATAEDAAKGIKFSSEQIKNGDIPVDALKKLIAKLRGTAIQKPDPNDPKDPRPADPAAAKAWDLRKKADAKKAAIDAKIKAPCWPVGMEPKRGGYRFQRDPKTLKFDTAQLAAEMCRVMEDPINQFGARNVPKVFKAIEILGILQARKWEVASLNEFREFFGLPRHKQFSDINSDPTIQTHLRDLYEHPDMVELYPGMFCEGKERQLDPGTWTGNDQSTTLWRCVFSDAVTLVRSDRFYTLDWNVNSLTSWGFKEVASDRNINKGSVMHTLFQRAFPGYFAYNSLHLWQPFYTPTKNAVLAEQQGYKDFLDYTGIEATSNADFEVVRDRSGKVTTKFEALCEPANKKNAIKLRRKLHVPGDPETLRWRGAEFATPIAKPVLVSSYDTIKNTILGGNDTSAWVNPHIKEIDDIPSGTLREIMTKNWAGWNEAQKIVIGALGADYEQTFRDYFMSLAQDIRAREERKFQTYKCKGSADKQVFQIDIVKDYAIPITTRFVADLLGFWADVKTPEALGRKYDENEIYGHIANCHNFESYDSDPTKAWKRRLDFKASIQLLKELAETGVARSGWNFGEIIFDHHYGDASDSNASIDLRKAAVHAVRALHKRFGQQDVAAIMLATALNAAQTIVLTFTETLAYFVDPKSHEKPEIRIELWTKMKKIVESETIRKGNRFEWKNPKNGSELTKYILEASRFSQTSSMARMYKPSGKQPKSVQIVTKVDDDGPAPPVTINEGQTVVLDLFEAYQSIHDEKSFPEPNEFRHDRPVSSYVVYGLTDKAATSSTAPSSFKPRLTLHISLMAITGMMAHVLHLQDLRVAHDKLGRLKRVETPEGSIKYANYQWDGLLSHPASWALRFDGFGSGVFTGKDNANQGHGMDQVWYSDSYYSKVVAQESQMTLTDGAHSTGFVNVEHSPTQKSMKEYTSSKTTSSVEVKHSQRTTISAREIQGW